MSKGITRVISCGFVARGQKLKCYSGISSKSYTEDIVPVYQKTVHSTSGGTSDMLNIKRLSISVSALSSDENWYVMLAFADVEDYKVTIEIQRKNLLV